MGRQRSVPGPGTQLGRRGTHPPAGAAPRPALSLGVRKIAKEKAQRGLYQ
jgi:hypothetical protein